MPKKVDPTERRKTFTLSAIDVIAEKGLEAVRLKDIAKASGVTTGSLTHYFNDKDQVIAAALDEVVTSALHQANRPGIPLIDMLAAFLPLDAKSQKAARVWLAYFGRAIGNPTLSDMHRQYYAEFQSQLIERLKREPTIPAERRALVADAAIAIVDGLLVRATLDPENWPAEKQLDHLKLLLAPLLKEPLPQQSEITMEETA